MAALALAALGTARLPSARAQNGYRTPVKLADLQETKVHESSGLAASRRTPGVYWTHNDSGDGPYLYATDRKGRSLATFRVTGAKSVDWEDIAAGPGTGDSATLYIGDIGDNNRSRKDTAVYRVWEPAVDLNKTGQTGQTMLAERYPYVYPDGPHDAETLLVHPKTGEIFIVIKVDSGLSGVYKFPMPLTRDRTATLEKVATVTFTNPLRFRGRNVGKLATGGDISPDGTKIAIRTYTDAFEWTIKPGQSVADALKGKPHPVVVPWIGQFESLCYSPDGKALLTTSEGSPCPLWEMRVR